MTTDSDILSHAYEAVILFPTSDNMVVGFQAFKTRAISHTRPVLEGIIEFSEKQGAQRRLFRPRFFKYYEKSRKLLPIHPDLVRQFFLSTPHILLDTAILPQFKEGLKEFLADFQIPCALTDIERCPSCAEKGQSTILLEKTKYRAFRDSYICIDCALEEVRRDLRAKNIHVDASVEGYLIKILKTGRNVDAVIRIFSGEQQVGQFSLVAMEKPDASVLDPMKVSEITNLHPKIVKMLNQRNIEYFMPIQVLAIKLGLITGVNLLAVAATSGGKTLVGELAALTAVLTRGKKVIYCVPLVALANTKYDDLKKAYQESIPEVKLGLRVGRTRLVVGKRSYNKDTGILDKNFIVGTYEGIDKLLRSGINLKDIGCVIIDEIQTVGEKERGPILDGLIARLRVLSPDAQVIGLSATIGNPDEFAKELKMQLAHYKGMRPTPLEKHVLLATDELNKRQLIKQLIIDERDEFKQRHMTSQTIVFTNSRRKTSELATFLRTYGIRTEDYHSGIPYNRRRHIEQSFSASKLDAVVATYALGAGVDFPASTVIFESVLMGIDVLTANLYNQMAGRAGRLGKHDRGRAIFVALPTPPNGRIARSEFEISVALSSAALEAIRPDYSEDDSGEQILATVCFLGNASLSKTQAIYDMQIGNKTAFGAVLDGLISDGLLIHNKQTNVLTATKLGKATSISFLKPSQAKRIIRLINNNIPPIVIVSRILPFENVFHSKKLQGWLERVLKTQTHVTNRFFNGPLMDMLKGESPLSEFAHNDPHIQHYLVNWSQKLFDCDCPDSPYCTHGVEKLSRGLLNLRMKKALSPMEISQYIRNEYGFFLYPGDVLRWMESIIHLLEGVSRISAVLDIMNNAHTVIKDLENPIISNDAINE